MTKGKSRSLLELKSNYELPKESTTEMFRLVAARRGVMDLRDGRSRITNKQFTEMLDKKKENNTEHLGYLETLVQKTVSPGYKRKKSETFFTFDF